MAADPDPIIRQFLSGRAAGPIGIDEMGEEPTEIELELRRREAERVGDEKPEIMTV
jgi:hypothetical protein